MTKLKYLVLSDIHLGSKNNTTAEIINNLDIFFKNYTQDGEFSELDIIFIAGDLFDRLLDMNDQTLVRQIFSLLF
jgi:DNA repair exonuclease SbcCD nuclease subunit